MNNDGTKIKNNVVTWMAGESVMRAVESCNSSGGQRLQQRLLQHAQVQSHKHRLGCCTHCRISLLGCHHQNDVQLESGEFCSQLCNVSLVSEFLTVLCAGYYTEGQVKVSICHMCDTSETVRNFFALNHLKNEQKITQLLNNEETGG